MRMAEELSEAVKPEIDVTTAAGMIRCSAMTVRRLLDAGELEGYRLTSRGHWRISRRSVIQYLARLKNDR